MSVTRKPAAGGRIPASELTRVKRWALPRVEGGHVVTSPFQQKSQDRPAAVKSDEMDLSDLTIEALAKLRADARREGYAKGLEEGRVKGEELGQKQGHDAGYKTAYSQAEGEINQLKTQLSGMIAQLNAPLEQQHQELEQALLRLVTDIARAVVGAELSSRPELLADAVQRALDVLPQQGELCFTVHPDDEVQLKALREQEGAVWEIRTDPALARGGLKVRGASSYLDYGVEGRFAEVMTQFHADAAEAPEVGDDGADQ